MLASASDYHTFHKFKPGGRVQAARTYLEAVQMTLDAGIRPRLHLEDATRAPMDFMLPFVEHVLKIAAPYGPALRPRFRVCDTMGLGLPYEDVALPRSIPRIFRALRGAGLQPEDLEFHPHNDTWLIVAELPGRRARGLRGDQRHLPGQGRAHRQRAARGRAAAPDRHGLLRRAAA